MHLFRLPAALIGLLAATAVLATPPDPPQVFGYGGFNGKLAFSWTSVQRENWYELWQRPNDGASWVKFATVPGGRLSLQSQVSTHLLDWEQVAYQLKACNPSGCGTSAVLDQFDGRSYLTKVDIKPSRAQAGAKFGSAIDLSEDGTTLVSVSSSETDVKSGRQKVVNIYLFNTTLDHGRWRQETRLFPSVTQPDSGDGVVANLSAAGNVLIVGLPSERTTAAATSPEVGAAYLFRREGTSWRQERRFTQAPGTPPAHYGFAAEISEDGNTVLIGRETDGGTAEVWTYADGAWSLAATIPGPANQTGCNRIRLSGDGQRVIRTCSRPPYYRVLQTFRAPAFALEFEDNIFVDERSPLQDLAVDYRGETWAWSAVGPDGDSQQIVGYRQVVNGVATRNNLLVPVWSCHRNSIAQTEFGGRLALSRDGQFIAVRDIRDTCGGTGSQRFPILQQGNRPTGAVFIYQYNAHFGGVGLRRILKPYYPAPEGGYFEGELAFAENGKALAFSLPGDTSGATDPYHHLSDLVLPDAGAITLY